MAHDISVEEIRPLPDGVYTVTVTEDDGSASVHTVRVDVAYATKLEGGEAGSVADLLRRSFAFLLAREPKAAILTEFDLRDIQTYFPEYEGTVTQ